MLRWFSWQYLFQDESERLTVCKNRHTESMIRPVIPARKVSEGRRLDRTAFNRTSRFETAPQFPKKPLQLGRWKYFFFFPSQSGRPWQSGDNETKWQWRRGEGLMRCSDSWAHLDLILQVIQHIVSSNQIHQENEEQIKKKKLGGGGGRKRTRKKSCGKKAWAELRHSSSHSHETDRSDETSPRPTFQFSPLLFFSSSSFSSVSLRLFFCSCPTFVQPTWLLLTSYTPVGMFRG